MTPTPRTLFFEHARRAPARAGVHYWGSARGFTLVELTVVLVIMAVAAAVAIPRFSGAQERYRVEAAAQRLRADINLARTRALTTSRPQVLEFKQSSNYYCMDGERDFTQPTNTKYEVFLDQEPYRVLVASVDFGGDETVVFNHFGLPDTAGEVVLVGGDRSRRVVLDPVTGKADIAP